jgi:hypothetical protein
MASHFQPSLAGLSFIFWLTRQFLPGYFHSPLPGLEPLFPEGHLSRCNTANSREGRLG